MSGPQFMPFYVGDYLRDTQHLSTEEHGIYLLLLMACWTMGALPDNRRKLGQITKIVPKKGALLRNILDSFFVRQSDGFWHQKRIDKERQKIEKIKDERSKAGSKGSAKRWQSDDKPIARARVPQLQPQLEPERKGKAKPQSSNPNLKIPNPASAPARAREAEPATNGYFGEEDFNLGSWKSLGRSAPLAASPPKSRKPQSPALKNHKKELLRQKLLRFVDATMTGPAKSGAFAGLCGADPEHSEQWWFDTVDIAMRRDGWDDTSEFWEGNDGH